MRCQISPTKGTLKIFPDGMAGESKDQVTMITASKAIMSKTVMTVHI